MSKPSPALPSHPVRLRVIQDFFRVFARSLRNAKNSMPTACGQCYAVNSERARVAVRKLKTINHACVSHRRPMNINENHCVVYRPINPGLKYSVFGGVLSVAAPRGSSAHGRRGEAAEGNIISPIDHPTRGPTPFLDPFRAARSLAARARLTLRAFSCS